MNLAADSMDQTFSLFKLEINESVLSFSFLFIRTACAELETPMRRVSYQITFNAILTFFAFMPGSE